MLQQSVDGIGPRPDGTANGISDTDDPGRDVPRQRLFVAVHPEIMAQPGGDTNPASICVGSHSVFAKSFKLMSAHAEFPMSAVSRKGRVSTLSRLLVSTEVGLN